MNAFIPSDGLDKGKLGGECTQEVLFHPDTSKTVVSMRSIHKGTHVDLYITVGRHEQDGLRPHVFAIFVCMGVLDEPLWICLKHTCTS